MSEAGIKVIGRKQNSIDETIARLNQTIEEIRSVETSVVRPELSNHVQQLSGRRRSLSPEKETRASPRRDVTPPINRARETTPPVRASRENHQVSSVMDRIENSNLMQERRRSFENRISPVRFGMEKEKSLSPPRSSQTVAESRTTFYQSSSQVTHSSGKSFFSFVSKKMNPVRTSVTLHLACRIQ